MSAFDSLEEPGTRVAAIYSHRYGKDPRRRHVAGELGGRPSRSQWQKACPDSREAGPTQTAAKKSSIDITLKAITASRPDS